MAVRDRKSALGISGYYGIVSVYFCSFFYCILDIRSGFLHCQVIPGIAPVVSGIQGDFFSLFLVACIKLHFDSCRAFSILVVSILPCFRYSHAGLTWCISVDDVVAIDRCGIIGYCILGHCVVNCSTIFIFRQIGETVFPVISCCYFFASKLCAIRQKLDCDTGWSVAILIVIIIPGFASIYVYCWCFIDI